MVQSEFERSPTGGNENKRRQTQCLPPEQANILTEDLATFLIAHHILISGNSTIASVKNYFARTPELMEIVGTVLLRLEDAGLIKIENEDITVKNRFIDVGGNAENLARFLPRLLKLSAERVLSDASSGKHKVLKEAARYFVVPDDAETAAEAQAIYLEFRAKMLALASRADHQNRASDGIRLVGLVNCALVPEDFV